MMSQPTISHTVGGGGGGSVAHGGGLFSTHTASLVHLDQSVATVLRSITDSIRLRKFTRGELNAPRGARQFTAHDIVFIILKISCM